MDDRAGANQVALRFDTASNWTYVLQGLDSLPAGSAAGWSNLFLFAAKSFDDQALFVDGVTNRQRIYRLLLSPSPVYAARRLGACVRADESSITMLVEVFTAGGMRR